MSASRAARTADAAGGPSEHRSREVPEARETGWVRPGFAKSLYLGDFDLSLIHPHPRPAPEDAAHSDLFLARLAAYCRTLDGARIEREDRIPDEYLAGLAELGMFGLTIAEEYGGLGLPLVSYGRALMLVGSVHPSIGALVSAHQSIGVPEPVNVFGTAEQKAEYLPRCAAGAISAFLLSEPDVGSDPARLHTSASLTADGSAYILDGVKLWATNGPIAELLAVMATVPEHPGGPGGITAFIVEADSPGITVENRNRFLGLRGLENGVTRFHQVRVPVGNRIGGEGQGLKIALTTLNTGRLAVPAMCAGAGKWALKIAREWSAERVQWGQPIGRHEAVATKLAFIAATTFALEAVFELSAALTDAGLKDVRIQAALAALWSSEMACAVADDLVQIRGGRGFETADSLAARGERAVPAEQLLRDLRIHRIFEGSPEIMRLLIAREAIDAHLAVAGDIASGDASRLERGQAAMRASGFYARWLPGLVVGQGSLPGAYAEFGRLARQLRFVERASRALARRTLYGMARWQAALEQKQAFLGRIVDIGAELFAMSAVCAHAEALRSADEAQGASAYLLAEAFCEQSRMRVARLFRMLGRNTDALDRAVAGAVLDGAATWLERGVLDPSEGSGPWIAAPPTGPSTKPNLRRRYR
jgi:alkylation response protein AidB-like acyl-CoA dehydrogenase